MSMQADKHDKMDVRPENLAALCQRCVIYDYDVDEHIQHAKETRQRRRSAQAYAAGQLALFCMESENL